MSSSYPLHPFQYGNTQTLDQERKTTWNRLTQRTLTLGLGTHMHLGWSELSFLKSIHSCTELSVFLTTTMGDVNGDLETLRHRV